MSADLQVCTAGGISRSRLVKRFALALGFALTSASALASTFHPANIPSARVHVNTNNTVELHIRFDILAFCLETAPQEIADGPMNALLDGPQSELQNRLNDAKNRLIAGTSVITAKGQGLLKSVQFPSSDDVYNCAKENGKQRLPVMLTVVLKETLPSNAQTISCKFPEVFGSVVVTTELPYEEPVSEPVDPGDASSALQIPSSVQVKAAAADMLPTRTAQSGAVQVNNSAPPHIGSPNQPQRKGVDKTAVAIKSRNTPNEKAPAERRPPGLHRSGDLQATTQAAKPVIESINEKAATEHSALGLHSSHDLQVTTQTAKPIAELSTPAAEDQSENSLPTPVGRPAWYILFARYIRMGFLHIIPQGLDHILFVLGLFLLSRNTKSLLTQISAFTIAHSITLGLSLYGVFSLPRNIVEPLIAVSIVFVAVENLFTTEMKAWRPLVVFGFGLVHGLGFASALKDAGLAHGDFLTGLVGFNCGVELGQLSVVALAFLAVGWFRTKPAYRPAIVLPASCVIAAIALFWTIQRIV